MWTYKMLGSPVYQRGGMWVIAATVAAFYAAGRIRVSENTPARKSAFPSRLIKASIYLVTHTDQDPRHTSKGEGLAGKQMGRGEKRHRCLSRPRPQVSSYHLLLQAMQIQPRGNASIEKGRGERSAMCSYHGGVPDPTSQSYTSTEYVEQTQGPGAYLANEG